MRVRLLSLLSAFALLVMGAVPASATSEGHAYLALGDSVPFGFSPLVNPNDAHNFVGYPEIVAQRLDIKDVNATCPGEATGGFLSSTGTDNVCRPYRAAFPLHTEYSVSQMDFTLRYLTGHRDTRLITLTLGANDLFRFQKDCAVDPTFGTCALGFAGVLGVMRANLDAIFAAIRATGYSGLIVGVTYYAINYSDPASIGGSLALGAQMAAAAAGHGVLIASGFTAWQATAATAGGDSCSAGLLIRTSATECDVHPTPLGRDLLANAVLDTIAGTCAAHDARACLHLNNS
ncbi:MAG TPA: GDSL-type esterase/lipase family protein [Verrucomicrobiae bacterium]|nr:GDSL-type esterase/lipase family protein [Verrucomicrobiae bacterium]